MTTMMHDVDKLANTRPRRVNINAIGRTSSGRLVNTLCVRLADKIIGVRERGGDFGSFEDMRTRVDGLGPVKIKALKEAGFVIEATRDRREAEEETTLLRSVRGQVDVMIAQTWRHREDQDLYTKQLTRVVETLTPEVDHVWE